ncbi:MAG: PDZ domain-containing protein [Paludibacter sp.]|jgi:carboxyl-terminal processing protease|nr:PDZ domain-containing protein [Paludibacter sp.]
MSIKKLSFLFLVVLAVNFSASSQRTFRISKNMSLFNAVFRELETNYVDTLNYDKMLQTAVGEMLAELDPYTVFLPEEETDDLTFMTTGEYGGIGALITKYGKNVCVSEPYEGMPAQKNDVRAGDIFLEIDGTKVSELSVGEVSAMLRGVPNTPIKLKLQRYGEKKPLVREFMREKIQLHPIAYSKVLDEKVGYIMLNDFTDRAAIEFKETVNQLIKEHDIQSIIIDIRENGGGLVDEAVKILGYFVPKGTEVVKIIGKNPLSTHVYKTPAEPLFPNIKLAVLVSRGSASASEILAGAIQDLDRGIIVGERTFGKGLVQNIRPLGYGAHLKVTTAKYYIPSGRCIQAIDYSHRNGDGSVGRVPDSLTTEFTTLHGRKVRDGGGIVPDIKINDESNLNISYYLYTQQMYFDFATQYVVNHTVIAKPSEFQLSDNDFAEFVNFLKEKNFTYSTQTEKYFEDLIKMAKIEGLDAEAKDEIEQLRQKFKPDIEKNLAANRADISRILAAEIIKRYYFQRGEIEYSLRDDKVLNAALENLQQDEIYQDILGNVKNLQKK